MPTFSSHSPCEKPTQVVRFSRAFILTCTALYSFWITTVALLSAGKFSETAVYTFSHSSPVLLTADQNTAAMILVNATGPSCKYSHRYEGAVRTPLVGLISTHGSGNTWLRFLIERLTGVCTGSVYKEPALRKAGFYCEMLMVDSNTAIVYKAHYYDHINANKNILLIRNPFDAIISDFNRINSKNNHTALASLDRFYTAEFRKFLRERSWEWLRTILTVLEHSKATLVVFYDNLKNQLEVEMLRIAKFLQVHVDLSRIECVANNSVGVAKRPARRIPEDVFSPFHREVIDMLIAYAGKALTAAKVPDIPMFFRDAVKNTTKLLSMSE